MVMSTERARPLVDERAVKARHSSIRLPGHQRVAGPRRGVVDDEAFAGSHQCQLPGLGACPVGAERGCTVEQIGKALKAGRHVMHRLAAACQLDIEDEPRRAELNAREDRKSTRLNSSHITISYAVFCLKKK